MKKILTIILCLAPLLAAAQTPADTLVLDVQQCRSLALERNAKVRIARGKAVAADEVKKEAFTKYFPTIDASGIAFQSNKHVLTYDVLDLFSIELIKKGITAGVTAVQPVFAGGQIVNGNKLAAVGAEAGQLQYQQAERDVALGAEQLYWQLGTLKAKRHTLAGFITMLDTIEAHVNVALQAGLITQNDLLKVQLQRNTLRSLAVDLDNGIDLMRNLLAQYVGHDGEAVDINDYTVPDSVPAVPYDLFVPTDQAVGTTIDYQLLEKQCQAADLQKRMTVGQNLPTVGIGAGYYYDNLFNQGHGFGAAFVAVNVPLSAWWGGSHAIKKSRIEAENARIEFDNASELLQIKMKDCWNNLTAAQRKMDIAHESIVSGRENLRMSQLWYDAGMSTITDLLDAQTLYRSAIDEYTQAYGDFCLARATYLNATGR